MNINLIKLTQSFTNFSETSVEEIINEYNTKQTLNSLFNSIIPQDNEEYSISFRKNYFKQILTKINPNFSREEEKLLSLFCLIRSYGSGLEKQIDEILQIYKKIQSIKYNTKYLNYIKYQAEFQIFCFIILVSEKKYPQDFILSLKEKIDEGNIIFKNYC